MHKDIPGASVELVDRVMFEIQSAVREAGVKHISLSPNNVYWAKTWYCQEWVPWLQKGWVDDVLVQMYFADLKDFDYNVKKTLTDVPRELHPFV
jgi:uncharacterized lipoprotein YddW (UPF0748 family)